LRSAKSLLNKPSSAPATPEICVDEADADWLSVNHSADPIDSARVFKRLLKTLLDLV
jgi:hypothetical protein